MGEAAIQLSGSCIDLIYDRKRVDMRMAAFPYWSAVCAPNLRQNERILLQDTVFKAISARKTTRDAIRLRSLQTIAIMWP
jgi:hypothetical protein